MHRNHRYVAPSMALLLATACLGTDTAFWKPYERDAATFLLESFDVEGAPAGRFGEAHRGPTAHVEAEPRLLLKGQVSLECWVKLDRLPKARGHLIRRLHKAGKTRGFELFIEPSGAFGVAVQNCLGTRCELKSDEARVPVRTWTHLAAISISTTYSVLYLDGKEVARVRLQGGQGLSADRKKETVPARVVIGDGVPGLIDEVRIHTNVAKLWPRPQQTWIAARAEAELPAITTVLAPGHEPALHLPFDGSSTPAVNSKAVKLQGDGDYVDGVRGQALRGKIAIVGKMASAREGAVELWCRPLGINNYSDQNVILFNNSLFTFYLFNTTRLFRPLTLYYRDREKKIHFARDKLATEVYPGKWDHYVFTWGGGKVQWYANGRQAGGTGAAFAATDLASVKFSPYQLFGDIDELYVYDRALSPVEAANTYWRYVDPGKVKVSPRAKLADLRFWHLPSSRELYAEVQAANPKAAQSPVQIQLKSAQGEVVFSAPATFAAAHQRFVLPELKSGEYAINLMLPAGETEPQVSKLLDAEQVVELQRLVRRVMVSEHVGRFAVKLVRASRPRDESSQPFVRQFVRWGAGPRAVQYLVLGAKARAVLEGTTNVCCDHVRQVAPMVLRHRVLTNFTAEAEGIDADSVVSHLLAEIKEDDG